MVGLAIRLYFTPWDIPTNSSDSFILMIEGIAYSEGDFTYLSHRSLWPLFLSGFFEADISVLNECCQNEGLYLVDKKQKDSWRALKFVK